MKTPLRSIHWSLMVGCLRFTLLTGTAGHKKKVLKDDAEGDDDLGGDDVDV